MKKYRVMTAVLAAALLCGCSDKGNSSQNTSIIVSSVDSSSVVSSVGESSAAPDVGVDPTPAESSVQSTADSEPESEPEPDIPSGDETFLVGLAGDRILKSEISEVFSNDGSDVDPEELTEDNFSAVLCEDFVYVARSAAESRNSYENSNVYDSGNMEFTDITSTPVNDYVRLNVGDTICGLTLREAQVNFARGSDQTTFQLEDGSVKTGAELGLPEIYFVAGSAKFDGELVMVGYICRIAEDEYGIGEGDIIFVPSNGEGDFPIMSYRLDGDNGFHHLTQVYALADLVWQNEFGYVYLGNAYDTTADISSLPDDGSFMKVQVTVDNFELNCGVNFVNSVRAEIVNVAEIW